MGLVEVPFSGICSPRPHQELSENSLKVQLGNPLKTQTWIFTMVFAVCKPIEWASQRIGVSVRGMRVGRRQASMKTAWRVIYP